MPLCLLSDFHVKYRELINDLQLLLQDDVEVIHRIAACLA
jgi:hypothetical protein